MFYIERTIIFISEELKKAITSIFNEIKLKSLGQNSSSFFFAHIYKGLSKGNRSRFTNYFQGFALVINWRHDLWTLIHLIWSKWRINLKRHVGAPTMYCNPLILMYSFAIYFVLKLNLKSLLFEFYFCLC